MIYFFGEYEERATILGLGAKWDFDRFMWCVEDPAQYHKFDHWLIGGLIANKLYILEANETCPFCGAKQKVYALACGEYYENLVPTKLGVDAINILYGLEFIPVNIEDFVFKKLKIKKRFSRAFGYEHPLNGCNKCNEVFTDSYLFDEEDSPFYVDSQKKASELKVYELSLDEDIVFGGMVKWSFGNNLFNKSKRVQLKREEVFKYPWRGLNVGRK